LSTPQRHNKARRYPSVGQPVFRYAGSGSTSFTMTSADDTRRRELRDFLMAHRGSISPVSVGLPAGGRRRTAGLRREELATVAGVSATWYTWLEQGRDIKVSADTLGRIAVALRLTPTDTAYLFSLALVAQPKSPVPERPTGWQQSFQPLLDAFRGPAFIVAPCFDVEAFNRVADRIYRFREHADPLGRNHVWRFFMDPRRGALYADWKAVAEDAVGILRAAYARSVGDPRFEEILRSLMVGSEEFRTLWAEQRTRPLTPEPIRLLVPHFGEVVLSSTRLSVPGRDDYLIILLPPADRASAAVMDRLSVDEEAIPERKSAAPRRSLARRRS
jgi:transcriptional regulator with XRE-family HTH domain